MVVGLQQAWRVSWQREVVGVSKGEVHPPPLSLWFVRPAPPRHMNEGIGIAGARSVPAEEWYAQPASMVVGRR